MLKLYHYTNSNIESKIKPAYFGENFYTNNENNISSIKRSFYFLDKKIPEYRFLNSNYLYTGGIDKNLLYDLRIDKKNLAEKFTTINSLLLYLKNHYFGVIYNVGYNVAILFNDFEFTKKIKRS